jgi:signal transduction histidine kinase
MFKISLLLLVGVLNASVALIVLSRNARKALNIVFALVAVAVALWVGGIAAFLHTSVASTALDWAKLYYIAPLIIVLSSVIFADVFPSGGRIKRSKLVIALIGFSALVIPIALSSNFLFSDLIYHSWGKEIILNKWPYVFYSLYLGAAFLFTLIPLYKKTKHERGVYRAQVTVFFYGYLTSCVLGVFFNLILPGFGNYQLIWIGPSTSTIYVVATAYGIVRHKLFDVRVFAARAVGYIFSIVALGAVYGVVAFGIASTFLGADNTTIKERVIYAVLAVLISVTFPATKKFFDRMTNRLFYQDVYDSQIFLDQLNKVLVTNIELTPLLADSSKVIADNLKAEFCLFGIKETEFRTQRIVGTSQKVFQPKDISFVRKATPHFARPVIVTDDLEENDIQLQRMLIKNGIAVIARLAPENSLHKEGLGYLVLGPKRTGNPYNGQDIKIISIITQELLIAIQNSLHYEEIEHFNVTLQERIEEATRKLRRTNEKLRQMDQTKDDFISMASHQLRTPLTSVKGYVSMVLDGDAGTVTPLQRKLLNQSYVSSQRMVYLISDLLNVSRLRTGKFIIEPIPSNLARVINEEIEQLKETAKGRNLELTYEKPRNFPTLMLDETKIRQVIMNFIDNAIYYTPSGGHISVSLVDKKDTIEFTVVDDGIGVSKHEQMHLFSKFFRAHNAKRARPDGTGLGLFMAKKVIVAQGGAIIFKSQEGKGSTFGFTFAKEKLLPEPDPAPTSDTSS